ncbi:MAG: amidase [Hyphomicrobiales bacterium]|nr:amidase [Hyphomicrobiales bacterium]
MHADDRLCRALQRIRSDNDRIHALSDVIAIEAIPLLPGHRLSGMPIVVKDMIDTTPARCSAGLPFLANYRPNQDAVVVRQLREAGATIVGVAETDAAGCGVRTPCVRHPTRPGHIVGGSSGGSAAAILAGFAQAAIGTDTGGSVRIPAACCDIVGFKPTYGRLSTTGVRPLAPSLDHVGVLGATVETVTLIMDVLDSTLGYRAPAKPALHGRSIAFPEEALQRADPAVRSATERVMQICSDLGYAISTSLRLPCHSEVAKLHWSIFAAEAAVSHREFLPHHLADYPSLARLPIEYGMQEPSSEYILAKRRVMEIRNDLALNFAPYEFLVLPTLPVLPPPIDAERVIVAGRSIDVIRALISNTMLFNHVGYPAIAIPVCPEHSGPSASVQIVGKPDRDADVLRFARRVEQALASSGP